MSRRVLALAIGALAALAVLVVGLAGARGAGADDSAPGAAMLRRSATALRGLRFDGTVVVDWRDAAGLHHQTVPVQVDDGVLHVGDDRLLSAGARRLLRTGSGWQLMWSGAPTGSEPDATAKYRFVITGPSQVADRPAQEVVVRRRGTSAPREVLYFDRGTGMLLRRDDLDAQGRLARRFAFARMTRPAPAHAAAPGDVPSSRRDAPRALAKVPSDLRAPKTVGRGFKLAGAYSQPDGSVQLYYSDGLFGLSVFERPGELDWGALPAGGRTEQVGDVRAHVYRTVAGTAVVWGTDEVTFTCVTDAPVEEVAAVTSSLAPASSSTMEDVGHFVTAPFSWG
jgi:hypothetical protein